MVQIPNSKENDVAGREKKAEIPKMGLNSILDASLYTLVISAEGRNPVFPDCSARSK
jgi:hypothetical protein